MNLGTKEGERRQWELWNAPQQMVPHGSVVLSEPLAGVWGRGIYWPFKKP